MGGAVRLVNRAADELTRTFKELTVQRLIDATGRGIRGFMRERRARPRCVHVAVADLSEPQLRPRGSRERSGEGLGQ